VNVSRSVTQPALRLVPPEPPEAESREPTRGGARLAYVVDTSADLLRLAPIRAALERDGLSPVAIHVDPALGAPPGREALAAELALPEPDRRVVPGAGEPTARLGGVIDAIERALEDEHPDVLLLAGDGDVMLAAALAAVRLGIAVVRVDAGLRRRDWTDRRDVNARLADHAADVLLTQCPDAAANLESEGCDPARLHYVGSTLVDVVRRWGGAAARRAVWQRWGLPHGGYVLVSLRDAPQQRPLDGPLADGSLELSRRCPVVIDASGLAAGPLATGVILTCPLGFVDRLSLLRAARAVVTDRDDVPEQASALGIPCLTLSATTERLSTLTLGTNVLLGADAEGIAEAVEAHWDLEADTVPLWDGRAARRAADLIEANYVLAAGSGG
jgi:UDP-N-acetylglucosamine 2-epimerase (non-hydrolysing)